MEILEVQEIIDAAINGIVLEVTGEGVDYAGSFLGFSVSTYTELPEEAQELLNGLYRNFLPVEGTIRKYLNAKEQANVQANPS